jgi:hypothetical protein
MNDTNNAITDDSLDTTITRTDAEIDASIQAKIDAAVEAATANGQVDPGKQIGVFVGTDGSIEVRNVSPDEAPTEEPGIPDPVDFPAMYIDETRESLADSYYKDHLESHWGF